MRYVGKFYHLAIFAFKKEVLIRIVGHTVKVHLALNHKFGKVQTRFAVDIKFARNEIFAVTVEPEAFDVTGLVSLTLGFTFCPELTFS